MNIQLIVFVVVLILFMYIFYKHIFTSKKENFADTPTQNSRYPVSLMKQHDDFIYKTSNIYNVEIDLINKMIEYLINKSSSTPIVSTENDYQDFVKQYLAWLTTVIDTIDSNHKEDKTNNFVEKDATDKTILTFLEQTLSKKSEFDNTTNLCKTLIGARLLCVLVLKIDESTATYGDGETDNILNNIKYIANDIKTTGVSKSDATSEDYISKISDLKERFIKYVTDSSNIDTTKYIANPTIPMDPNDKKKQLIEITQWLFKNIYSIFSGRSMQSQVSCVLYDDKKCPVNPYKDGKSGSDPSLTYKSLDTSISNKYKCRLSGKTSVTNKDTEQDKPICIDNINNKYKAESCEIMSGYGEEQCKNTTNISGTDCTYDTLTQRCLDDNTNIITKAKIANADGKIKCLNIYNRDKDTMKTKCEESGCLFLDEDSSKTDSKKICVPTNLNNVHNDDKNKVCLAFSNFKNINTYGHDIYNYINGTCDILPKQKNNIYVVGKGKKQEDLKCEMFDQKSNYTQTQSGTDFQNTIINKKTEQEKMCESLVGSLGDKTCRFYSYTKPIDSNLNSKYQFITTCRNKTEDIPDDYLALFRKKEHCSGAGNYVWSERNDMCIKVNEECKNVDHKDLCNKYRNCIWQQTGEKDAGEFERGYCRDVTSQLKSLEDKMDGIHSKHINNMLEVNGLESKLVKMMPTVKNALNDYSNRN